MGTARVKVTRKATKKSGNSKGTVTTSTKVNVSFPKVSASKSRTVKKNVTDLKDS